MYHQTSHTMAFALYLLAKNPDAQRKLQQEVDQVLKDNPETLTPAHIAKLSYTKAVVKESLRFVSFASVQRERRGSHTYMKRYECESLVRLSAGITMDC